MRLKFSEGYFRTTGQKALYVYGEIARDVTQLSTLNAIRSVVTGERLIEFNRGQYHLIGWRIKLGKDQQEAFLVVSVDIEPYVLVSLQGGSVNQMKRYLQDLFTKCRWTPSDKVYPASLIQPAEDIILKYKPSDQRYEA